MKKQKSFRKGNIVQCGTTIVLVTGVGDKILGYSNFAGVVLNDSKCEDEEFVWRVGTYLNGWSTTAFKRINLNLSQVIAEQCL